MELDFGCHSVSSDCDQELNHTEGRQRRWRSLYIFADERTCSSDLAKLMFAPDTNGTDKLNEVYNRVIAMPSRVDVMKKLSDTLKTLTALEREVFGIDAKEAEGGGAIESVIKRVMAPQSNGD